MKLGRVVGTVWGAKQSVGLKGRRIVEVQPLHFDSKVGPRIVSDENVDDLLADFTMMAVDPLGADIGQLVLVAVGSRVRDLVVGPDVETKNCVIAIVDRAELG